MLLGDEQNSVKYPVSELYSDLPVHHWTELQGNKFRFKIKLFMLVFDDYKERVTGNITGRSKGTHNALDMQVVFDRDYVKQKLAREVVKPLSNFSKDKFLELMSEIYDEVHGK